MIQVVDNFLSSQDALQLHSHALTAPYYRLQSSDHSNRDSLRYAHHFDVKLFDKSPVMNVVRKHVPGTTLLSAYINASDFNTTTLCHTDGDTDNETTVIAYLNSYWQVDYQGSTMFFGGFGDDEVIKTVFPKPRRAVIFNSSIPHLAGIPSADAPVRYTLAIKLTKQENEEQKAEALRIR